MTFHRLLALPVLVAASLILLSPGGAHAQCVVPDNGSGTVTLPPANCAYLSPDDVHRIVAGLAPGTTIELGAIHQDFICKRSQQLGCSFPTPVDCDQPGGALGGEQECAHSSLQLTLHGTGQLGGFVRNINLPIDFEAHVGPRTPGQPVQSFNTDMFRLDGQITGDPDFDLLRIRGGTAFGMPSPGHTTLRQQGTSWAVDSFFDITYRIDFVGAPGGALAGRTGSTTGTIRMATPAAPSQCLHGSLDCYDANPCTTDHCELATCIEPDNGGGTANLPPQGCGYVSPDDVHKIINGLPPGTTLEVGAQHAGFLGITRAPGGTLGGERENFNSALNLRLRGTGSLAGYQRAISVSIACETHVAPRTPGNPVQSFDTLMFSMQGTAAAGDPDFDLLRITGGNNFGMPSPGHTTLTQQADGTWAVESFFDITYRVDFIGHSPGPLGGMSGSTTATIRMTAGLGGTCTHGPTNCSDGDNCTVDSCDPAGGCTHDPIVCDDADPCTTDTCTPFEGTLPTECLVNDNGGGTVTLPPAGCAYLSPDDVHEIVGGLPLGTTVQLAAIHDGFACGGSAGTPNQVCTFPPPIPGVDCDQPGGTLGGEEECSDSTLHLDLTGTGMLAGYNRTIALPIGFETHTAPRTPGAPVQSFDTDMFRLMGEITSGDPDFDLLRITAGTGFGLPSPGHTTLTRQVGGKYLVDSFFDITYRIDFVGAPGGPLAGRSGSTTGTIRMATGSPCAHQSICDDNNPCTVDHCDPTTGQCSYTSLDCNDNNPCTVDTCTAAAGCVNDPLNCDDGNACTNDFCNPALENSPANPCDVTDNGGGTVTLPPAGCEYLSPTDVHKILDGLPAGTTIEFGTIHKDFICHDQPGGGGVCSFTNPPPGVDCDQPGGDLGGEKECSQSSLAMKLHGTGGLAGFDRPISVPITFETHVAPRTPGAPVQSFDTEMYRLFGQITGDPDFDLLRIVAGNNFGLPSPGHTTLRQKPGNQWAVDSFFDITYRIDFVGAAGGHLAGRSGSTTGTIRMSTGGNACLHTVVDCNDDNPCTLDSCNPATGCVHTLIDCNDGNQCTADSCVEATGGCIHTQLNCNDNNPCTNDSCSAVEGTGTNPCVVTDNGGGTVTLPPAGCAYLGPDEVHQIIDGLPVGTTIEVAPIHKDFICGHQGGGAIGVCTFPPPVPGVDCDQPGGNLGGEQECSDSDLGLHLKGTGMLAGYDRTIDLPIQFETHTAPRIPGNPVQSFDTDMFRLYGQITGDPDFDLLRITAGTGYGLPSPGHTTLTQLPGGQWNVDSFFDITYTIDFVGAAGGPLAGRSGSTTATIRMAAGDNPCLNQPVDCNDNNACTTDFCSPAAGGCVHQDVNCDDGNFCTADSCVAATGCIHPAITCVDQNVCTSDSCNPASGCVFTPLTAPGDVAPLKHESNKSTISWPPDPNATSYDVVRGRVSLLPVGPGGGDELCLPTGGPSINDFVIPLVGQPAFYVVRAKNQTCPSASGYGRTHSNPGPPLNGPPRNTTTCP